MRKGWKMPPRTVEHRRNLGIANKGKKRTQEFKDRVGDFFRGRPSPRKGVPLLARRGKLHSEETKRHLSNYWKGKRKGQEHPRWVDNRNLLAKASEKRNDTSHHEWARNVKMRDKWKCKIENKNCSGRLEAHHILTWREFPELRYQLNNGITLCHAHHPRGRAEEKRLQAEFQQLVSVSNTYF